MSTTGKDLLLQNVGRAMSKRVKQPGRKRSLTVRVIHEPSSDAPARLERVAKLLLAQYVKDKNMPPHKESETGSKIEGEGSHDR